MKLKTTLFGNVYQFKDVKEVLAKVMRRAINAPLSVR